MLEKRIAIYIRLSSADEDTGRSKDESNSVKGQRNIINHFLDNHSKLSNYPRTEFVDDGFTGTNTNRPAFQRMIADIKNGKYFCCITNIKTPHLIQSQTKVQTSEVLATRAFEVFCCPDDALFCQQARIAQKPLLYGVGANGCIFRNVIVGKVYGYRWASTRLSLGRYAPIGSEASSL